MKQIVYNFAKDTLEIGDIIEQDDSKMVTTFFVWPNGRGFCPDKNTVATLLIKTLKQTKPQT